MNRLKDFFKNRTIQEFLIWATLGLLCVMVGLSRVNADTINFNDYDLQVYDNSKGILKEVTTTKQNNFWSAQIPIMIANSSGAAVGIGLPFPIVKGHIYSIAIDILEINAKRLALSTYNRVGIGNSMNDSKNNYTNNNASARLISSKILNDDTTIQFVFEANQNANYITFPFGINERMQPATYRIFNVYYSDIGVANQLSQEQINQSLQNQTEILQNQNTANKNEILNNQNQNKDDIIANQDKNNQDLIDSNKHNLNTCRPSKNLLNIENRDYEGVVNFTNNKMTLLRDYSGGLWIPINLTLEPGTYSFTTNQNTHYPYFIFRNFNSGSAGETIGETNYSHSSVTFTISEKVFVKELQLWFSDNKKGETLELMFSKSNKPLPFEEPGKEVCKNKIDETNDNLNDLNNNITDDNTGDPSGKFEEFKDTLANEGPLTKLFTLPITMYQSVLNQINGACKPFKLGNLLGTDLDLSCIDLKSKFGANLWATIDLILSGMSIWFISRKLIKIFDNLSELRGSDVM